MKKWFQNRNLFVKILSGWLVSILLIALSSLIIISYFLKNSDRSDKIHAIAGNISIQMYKARLADKNFVQRDLYKKEFHESGESYYLKKHRSIISSVQAEIFKLINLLSGEKREYFEKLLQFVNEYNSLFLQLVDAYRKRGFKDWGLQGEWRQAIHDVENIVTKMHSLHLLEDLLQLRRYEKDYLLRGEGEYIQKHEFQLKNLQNRITKLDGPESITILKRLNLYETAFKKYIAIQKKLGRTDEEGLQGDFLRVIRSMEPVIERTFQEAHMANQKARRYFIQMSLWIYIFGIGLGSAIFYLFARSISLTLTELKNAVLSVGKGKLDTKIAIKSRDDIGIVAAAFNKMTEDLKQATVSKDYVDKIIESMADMLIVIEPDAKIKTVNQATLDILGYREDELIGNKINMVFGGKFSGESFIDDLTGKGFVRNVEEVYLKKDGSKTAVLFSGSIMRDNSGKIQAIVCVAQDNTERKRAEDILRRSEKELRLLSAQILAAQEKERKRVARELHDGIGQSLTAIKFWVENNLKISKKRPGTLKKKGLKPVVPMIQDAIDEIRKISMDLRPSTLDDLGITATISWFCRQFQRIYSGIHVEKEVDIKKVQLPDTLTTAIFRVMQEALNNVAKHSKADLVHITLLKKGESIELVVEDNGIAFSLEDELLKEHYERGFGLAGMRERTELSGGILEIQSSEGKGTIIRALWPCPSM